MQIHEYTLKNGIFSQPRKLIIAEDHIEYQNQFGAASAIIYREAFEDVRYLVEAIHWDMWRVGSQYTIDIRYDNGKIMPLRFCQYRWKPRNYGQIYTETSAAIGRYFLTDKINQALNVFYSDGFLKILELTITSGKVIFKDPYHEIPFDDLGLKEYHRYFAIFDKSDPNIHKRVTFYEWNAELLYNTLKRILSEKHAAN